MVAASDLDRGRVPEEVRALLRRRHGRPVPTTRRGCCSVAAVVGREFDLRVLERTTELGVAGCSTSSPRRSDAGVIAEDPAVPRRYTFVHELVRETLYDDLAAASGSSCTHDRRGARGALPQRPRSRTSRRSPTTWRWRRRSGDVSRAVDYLVRAGDRAAEPGRLRGGRPRTTQRALGCSAPRRRHRASCAASCCCASATRTGEPATRARARAQLRGGGRARAPPRRRRDARARGARLRDRARRLPAVRPLRGRRDRDRPARGGARRAARRGQPAARARARAPGGRDLLLERGRAARSTLSTEAIEMARRLGDSEALVDRAARPPLGARRVPR